MNIFSKELLYKSGSTETFEVYIITRFAMTSVGTIRKPNLTFGNISDAANSWVQNGKIYYSTSSTALTPTQYTGCNRVTVLHGNLKSSSTAYLIDEGKLIKLVNGSSKTQIGNDTTWRLLFTESITQGFAVNSSGLYLVENTSTTLISSITSWDKITGSGKAGSTLSNGYGIADGKLYYLYGNGDGAVQQGTDTTWTDVTYSRGNETTQKNYRGYGLNGGKLYLLGDTPTQVGSSSTWQKISGGTSTTQNNGYKRNALGINSGKLYRLEESSATQIGTLTNWVNCSGYASGPSDEGSSSTCGLAYTETALYKVFADGTATKLMDGDFVYCSGSSSRSMTTCAMAIRRVTE